MEGFHVPLDKYQFPFENVVFEGGSHRLLPFCGAVKTLEECGAWKQVKRLAGSGTGAVMASLLAVGLGSQQLEQLFKDDLDGVIRDGGRSTCCLCCATSGYNPGRAVVKWVGARFKECAGKADVTFYEVQKRFNRELCIVATNLTKGTLEYHHPKTTPDLKVADSVRMSLAVPVLMESVREVNKSNKTESWMVEGGILCNYPVHAYDGWWLSMDEDQAFLKRLPLADSPTGDRFATFNKKTLGFITCDESSLQKLPPKLREQVEAAERATRPQDSKLLRNIEKLVSDKAKLEAIYGEYSSLAAQLIKSVEDHKRSRFDNFTKDDLRSFFTKNQLSDDELCLLFGATQTDDIFRKLLPKDKKEVSVQDVYNFLERGRRNLQVSVGHATAPKIRSNAEQMKVLSDILHSDNLDSSFARNDRNVDRTVVVHTGYVDSRVPGKCLSKQDVQYLVEQGRTATRHYLESYIKRVPLLRGSEVDYPTEGGRGGGGGDKRSFCRDDLKQFIDDDVSEVIDEKDYLESYLEKVL